MRTRHPLLRLLAIWALLGAYLVPASAAPPPDRYADAVRSYGILSINPQSAVGAPDQQVALVAGALGQDLVLDMGAGEEGTGNLIVYYRGIGVSLVTSVQFLDANEAVLATAPMSLVGLSVSTFYSATVNYPAKPAPYRYVRFVSLLTAYTIDAVAAATYRPDSDGDGLPDAWELQYALNPLSASGTDGAGGDPDSDGLSNAQEYAAGTNPRSADVDPDGDGLPTWWENSYGLNPISGAGADGAGGDPDGDGLTNAQEFARGTNPRSADSDGDGIGDGQEIAGGTNPTNPDSDGDGLNDGQEIALGTNPLSGDTDGDGLPDG